MADVPEPRKGMPAHRLGEAAFRARFLEAFQDPAFDSHRAALDEIAKAAFDGYVHERKSPVTRKAGPGYADPDYDLSVDWIAAKAAVDAARARHDEASAPRRVLLINGSSRSEHTCPGEMSKSYRLIELAQAVFDEGGMQTELLDLSRLAADYGRKIHPCKACFSTAAALCHWPCSCYPNYSLGQTQDWMNNIYPMWVAAHGVMIVSPVNWYHASSPVKLMIDRLVCADGGNPDPSLTQGKDARKAKEEELKGWPYTRHLEGRLFSVVVHGDAEGAADVRRALSDWMTAMGMQSAGGMAELDRYIGYYEPYAANHEALDRDTAIQEEARNAARTLLGAVKAQTDGRWTRADETLKDPRPK
ncbi:MAG: flavodoxin family protein [Caulobacteraceae bacterium]